ncbi:MAG: tRNA pseudouridine(55) synthase TruB [Alphaproteobacteria bacterium]|nr:tRNA pseudouridine(55) synthase TruB [Alphaproteobacteria bacterium]
MTSTQVIGKVRTLFQTKKVGHLGTLDPLATGVLPIALGEATKTIPFIQNHQKEYIFDLFFGLESEKGDLEGISEETLENYKKAISKGKIANMLSQFVGEIEQIPPAYSAIKIKGVPAYKRIRKGQELMMPPRKVRIDSLEILEQPASHILMIKCRCGLGTYIRSLGRDIAHAVGEKALLSKLRRTQSGCFLEKDSFSLEILKKFLYDDQEAIADVAQKCFVPLETVLDDIPALSITEDETMQIRQGKILQKESPFSEMRLMFDTQLIAIGKQTAQGIQSLRVFNF